MDNIVISFPWNNNFSTERMNKYGLSLLNYQCGKRRVPTQEQWKSLEKRLCILYILAVCPQLSNEEAKSHLELVNNQAWVLENGRFIGSTRLVDEAIANGGSDGLRRILGEEFDWVFTQSDLTKQMNRIRART